MNFKVIPPLPTPIALAGAYQPPRKCRPLVRHPEIIDPEIFTVWVGVDQVLEEPNPVIKLLDWTRDHATRRATILKKHFQTTLARGPDNPDPSLAFKLGIALMLLTFAVVLHYVRKNPKH